MAKREQISPATTPAPRQGPSLGAIRYLKAEMGRFLATAREFRQSEINPSACSGQLSVAARREEAFPGCRSGETIEALEVRHPAPGMTGLAPAHAAGRATRPFLTQPHRHVHRAALEAELLPQPPLDESPVAGLQEP